VSAANDVTPTASRIGSRSLPVSSLAYRVPIRDTEGFDMKYQHTTIATPTTIRACMTHAQLDETKKRARSNDPIERKFYSEKLEHWRSKGCPIWFSH
jgi:hypothetical protein